MEISVHELISNVNIVKDIPLRWGDNVPNGNNVFMIHMSEQLDLPQSPLCIDLVVESIRNLLNGHVLARLRIQSRAVTFPKIQSFY